LRFFIGTNVSLGVMLDGVTLSSHEQALRMKFMLFLPYTDCQHVWFSFLSVTMLRFA